MHTVVSTCSRSGAIEEWGSRGEGGGKRRDGEGESREGGEREGGEKGIKEYTCIEVGRRDWSTDVYTNMQRV